MPQVIETRSDLPWYDLQVDLDGVTVTLELRWNVHVGAWYLAVLDADAVDTLQAGIRVVADFPLSAYWTGRTPPGALVAIDTAGDGRDPGVDDLGSRVVLVYFTAAELAAA